MKKVILGLSILSLVFATSCKKDAETVSDATTDAVENTVEATTDAANATTDAVASAVSDVPKFSSPEVQKFAEEYAAYTKEMTEAAKSGDAAKIKELTAKAQEWSTKTAALAGKMNAEDAKLWQEYAMKLAQSATAK